MNGIKRGDSAAVTAAPRALNLVGYDRVQRTAVLLLSAAAMGANPAMLADLMVAEAW
jgi:hypothetical protein